MGLLLIGFSSFVIALSGALVPGPLFTITVAESAKRGPLAGPLIILGHGILELSLVVLIIAGIAPFLASSLTRTIICTIGGFVLIYMGYRLIKDGRNTHFSSCAEEPARGIHPVLSGIIGSVSNPYWTIWWVTIGMGYLISSVKFGITGVAVFFIGHISADFGWYSLVSFAVAGGKRVMGDRGYRFLLCSCGMFLIFFGGWFLTDGLI
jgi:threonine/homoserine/homoserine lactone efflux protein